MPDISLYLDEDVRVLLAEVLRSRGYRATHVLEAGRAGRSDDDQLVYAVEHRMTILTHNVRDYTILDKSYQTAGKDHFGIIVSEQISFSDLLRRTLKCLSVNSRKSLKNNVIWLGDFR